MSFSSRLICNPAPPVSAQIRKLGFLLWAVPIVISSSVLLLTFQFNRQIQLNVVNNPERLNMFRVINDPPPLQEPATFARTAATPLIRTALTLSRSGDPVFPLAADAWKHSAFATGKIALKVDSETNASADHGKSIPIRKLEVADIERAARASKVQFSDSRTFRRVRVLGATAIQADNVKIVLAGIEPLPQETMCKRLDGVMQSCNERAEHRLAILLQARSVSCELSESAENGIHTGRCMADKIDIADDLLRQKLAQRGLSRMASNL